MAAEEWSVLGMRKGLGNQYDIYRDWLWAVPIAINNFDVEIIYLWSLQHRRYIAYNVRTKTKYLGPSNGDAPPPLPTSLLTLQNIIILLHSLCFPCNRYPRWLANDHSFVHDVLYSFAFFVCNWFFFLIYRGLCVSMVSKGNYVLKIDLYFQIPFGYLLIHDWSLVKMLCVSLT